MGKCEGCGNPIDPTSDFRLVQGFERIRRDAGGTNAIRLREATETFLCRWCVDRKARGLEGQQAMRI